MRYLLAVIAAASLLAGCSNEPDVPWEQYAPEFREDVESAVESGDCAAMNEQFWRASDGSDAHRARFGEGNGDLMSYINDAMSDAGCD
jgi:outer membrane murein-binding lipoprotein Lpp